jgi:thiamine-monophosphate kinase
MFVYLIFLRLCYNPAVKVSDLGEFGLIKVLADIIEKNKNPNIGAWQQLIIGIGDDAAAWKNQASFHLATTDCLIQDVHFDMNTSAWDELGWKAIAVNLSDIAAMGGVPGYALVSLALPGEVEVSSVSSLYQGMIEACNRFDIAIVGGNISSSNTIMINITVLGTSQNKDMLTRSAAKVGDKIAVTGYTGLSSAGLRMLKQNLKFDKETSAVFRGAHLKPIPRVIEGQIILKCGVRSAIDISDGLIADLSHICERSNVGARINIDILPIHPLIRDNFKGDFQQMALTGGEDYELLFTGPADIVKNAHDGLDCKVTIIGEIIDDRSHQVTIVDNSGNTIPLSQTGWEHFKLLG